MIGTMFRFVVVASLLVALGAGIVDAHGTAWMRSNLAALAVAFIVGAAAMGLVVRTVSVAPRAAGPGLAIIGRPPRTVRLEKCPGCGEESRYLAREHATVCRECGLMHL